MNVHYFKELWKSSLMILMLCFGMSSVWGQTETITITQTSAGITQGGYNSGEERTWTQDEIEFGAKAVMKQSGQARIQFQANNGVIYNTSPLPGRIVSVSINQEASNVFSFFGGNSNRLVNATTNNYIVGGTQVGSSSSTGWSSTAFNETNYTYFAIKKGSNVSYVNSITIEYEIPESEPCDPEDLTAGTAVSNVAEVASGGSVNLSLNGASTGSGLSYQWQSSTNGTDWNNIDGATNATYTATNITAAIYFRAVVTCGGSTVYSDPVAVNIAYCLPDSLPSSEYEHISKVTVGTDIDNTTEGTNYTFYSTPIANLTIGESTEVSITITNGYPSDNVFLFIDWNQDKDFSNPNEVITLNYTAANGIFEATGTITPPVDAVLGNTRMRIKLMDGNISNPCESYQWGEIEDYTVNIVAAGPILRVDPISITGLQSVENGVASTATSFILNGQNLDGSDVTVTADGVIFEIAETEEGTYSDEIILTTYDGSEQTIWVRLAANQAEGLKNEIILISGGGADDVEITVSGEVLSSDPILNVSEEEITNLGYTFGASTSTPASFTISGLNMDGSGDVILAFTESTDFEMSLTAEGTYTDDLLIEEYDGTETTIYVRLKSGLSIGATYADILEILTDYGVEDTVLVFAEVTAPVINTTPVIAVPTMTAVAGQTDTETVTVSGTLTAEVTAQITGDDAGQFSVTASVTSAGGDLTVTYQPTTVGTHTAILTLTTNGGVTKELSLSGTATLGVPVATAATLVGQENFTANWEAVVGADSYEIDVYTMESGGFATDLFISEYVEGSGSNKALEIYNGTNSTVNLADYTIIHFNNGATRTSGTRYALQLNGNLESGNTYVIVNNSASEGLKAYADLITSSQALNFNGDDAIAIYRSVDITGTAIASSAIEIDLLGKIGEDPGTEWGTGLTSTSDNTLRRKSTISVGVTTNPSNFDPSLEWDGFATDTFDGLGSHTFDGGLTQVYMLQAENVGNVTSYQVTGLDPETTYYYVVRAVAGEIISANSNEIEVETLETPTAIVWTTDNEWSNGTGPTITDDVIIEGDNYVVTGNVAAKTLTVANGGKITVAADTALTVEGKITNNGDFIVESDGILYQNNYTGANEGDITVERDAKPMRRLDYTLWSSPVSGMLLNQFSNISNNGGTGTIWNRVYELGAEAWTSVWGSYATAESSTATFTAAKGYLYRAFNSYDPIETTIFTGEFTGVPNNGNYTINTPNTFDAVGNPYPSPIAANTFISNNGVDAIYFWTNVNSSNGVAYTHNNWASYTLLGGVGVAIGGDSENIDPDTIPEDNKHIQPGQGFVVYSEANSVSFDNTMRTNTNGAFFREMASDKSRFWLNLSNNEVAFNQILVGYMDNATQGVDTGIDAKMFGYEGNALYSIIDNSEDMFVIQGRSLPFEASDVVALGFRAVNAGSFTISLHNFDGLFAEGNTTIYLKDNYTQTQHNLMSGAYSFISDEGMFDNRFEVVYQTTMSVENPVANNANWVVYNQGEGYQIQTQGFELQNVTVFDLLGRTIYTAKAEGTGHNLPALGADSVYIVKITTTDNVVLSKKVK